MTTTTDKRCGTCRYFGEENDGEPAFCAFTVWKRYVLEDQDKPIGPDDGAECNAWERKQ